MEKISIETVPISTLLQYIMLQRALVRPHGKNSYFLKPGIEQTVLADSPHLRSVANERDFEDMVLDSPDICFILLQSGLPARCYDQDHLALFMNKTFLIRKDDA